MSESLKKMFNEEIFLKIKNRSTDEIFEVLDTVCDFWSFDIHKRKPVVVFEENGIKLTTLDLLTFLYSLQDRGAVIKIPNYKSLRPTKTNSSTTVMSTDRMGKIIKLLSNKDTFNFSVSINDTAVVSTNDIGHPRAFTLTNFDGSLYEGWERIDFVPDAKENKYIIENYLQSNDKSIRFDKFINEDRWVSFFSKHYIISKYAIQMLRERNKFYNTLLKEMKNSGKIKFNDNKLNSPDALFEEDDDIITKEKGKSIKVTAFNVEVDLPINTSEFDNKIEYTIDEYNRIKELKKKINKYVTKLQVMTRACEFAHTKNELAKPSWIKTDWEINYRTSPKSKTNWDRLVVLNDNDKFVAIRKRSWEKSETVSD